MYLNSKQRKCRPPKLGWVWMGRRSNSSFRAADNYPSHCSLLLLRYAPWLQHFTSSFVSNLETFVKGVRIVALIKYISSILYLCAEFPPALVTLAEHVVSTGWEKDLEGFWITFLIIQIQITPKGFSLSAKVWLGTTIWISQNNNLFGHYVTVMFLSCPYVTCLHTHDGTA